MACFIRMLGLFLGLGLCLGVYSPPLLAQSVSTVPVVAQVKRLFAQSTTEYITLHWDIESLDDVTGIQLYRKEYALPVASRRPYRAADNQTIELGELLAELSANETSYQDNQVKAGRYYYYRLVLQRKVAGESKPSAPAIALLKDETPPLAPQRQSLSIAEQNTLRVQWEASPSSDVVAYRLYRATLNGTPRIIRIIERENVQQQQFAVTLKHNGHPELTYRYALAAVDANGNVSKKTPYQLLRLPDAVAPRIPSLLDIEQQDKLMVLSWQANREDDLAGYRVYRRDVSKGAEYQVLHDDLLTDPLFLDDAIQPLKAYEYRVTAVDRFGNESIKAPGILMRTYAFDDVLSGPFSIRLQNVKGGVEVRWQDRNKAVYGFIVYRSDGKDFMPVSGLVTGLSFIDRSVRDDRAYRYQVVALDRMGKRSEPSAAVLWTGSEQ